MPILSHDQFEELSALAAAGEIGHDDYQMLKAHLAECASCRSVFTDVGQIQSEWLPEHPDFEIARDPDSDLRLRKAIFKRVTKAGARFSKAAQSRSASAEAQISFSQAARPWLAAMAAAVVVVTVGALLYRIGPGSTRTGNPRATEVVITTSTPPAVPSKNSQGRWKETEARLQQALTTSEGEQARLRQQLEEARKRAVGLDQSNADANRLVADLSRQLEAARTAQAKAETELAALRSERSTNEAVALVQEQEIRTLKEKLGEQSASVDRERQLLSAGREIRDLIAARNLHIVDVYDTDSRGKTSRAFGRVFYTEGKSLVFYAYDLSAQHPENTKYAFYVWGKRDGTPQMAKNLGALAKDDPAQKRWVLTITDPNVLAEIDSVFVTLEPTGQAADHPSGKRMLTAFLGTPANHP